tara:strand:+ start:432 stop:1511 length:1080 start_codon:yes stop_codon:yes gene_type:complete
MKKIYVLPLLASLALLPTAFAASSLVSISCGNDKKLALYRLDLGTGTLASAGETALDGSPGSQFVSPDGQLLYVSVRSSQSVAAFRIDHAAGKLVPLGSTPIGANAAYVATDRTGRTLLWASYSGGVVGTHAIGANGKVNPGPLSRLETARCAHAILVDASNRFAFVPHTCPNAVYQFRFDAKTGKLTPNTPATVTPAEGLQPRHLAFHPTLPVVYFDDERGDSVTAYSFDKKNGTVKPFQTISTLPKEFDGNKNSCADIEISRDGRFVYASNRGHNSIAGFAVDAKTGRLSAIGRFGTGDTPRSFNVHPNGLWAIAAGQRSHDLSTYRRDPKTGKLTQLKRQPTGKGPSWVEIIPLKK